MSNNRPLTKRQELFAELYLQCWKPSEAARQAGYSKPDQVGAKLLKNPLIAALVGQRMAEVAMQTNEVLARLAQQGRANLGDFYIYETRQKMDKDKKPVVGTDGKPVMEFVPVGVNWELVKERGYLIKKIGWSRRGEPILELYDAQGALVQIGKAQGLFVDRVEETHHLDQMQVTIYLPGNQREQEPGEGAVDDEN